MSERKPVTIRLSYSLKDFCIKYNRFKALLETEGFDAYIPRKRTPGEILLSVANRLAGAHEQDGYRYKVIVVKTHESERLIEEVVLAARLDRRNRKITDGDKVARILFDKDFGVITSFFPDTGPVWGLEDMGLDLKPCPAFLREAIKRLPEDMDVEQTLVPPSQVRGTFLRIVSSVGIPVDGILATWNLPVSQAGVAESLRRIAKQINQEAEQRVMRFDAIEICEGSDLIEDIRTDALVFATKELEKLLLIEQEKIEVAPDPDKAHQVAMARFSKEAEKLMVLIGQHRESLGEEIDKIDQLRKEFESLLCDFEIPMESCPKMAV